MKSTAIAVIFMFAVFEQFLELNAKVPKVYSDALPKCKKEAGIPEGRQMNKEETNCVFACQLKSWNITNVGGTLDDQSVLNLVNDFPETKLDEYFDGCDIDESDQKKFECEYAGCLLNLKFDEDFLKRLSKKHTLKKRQAYRV